MLHISLVTSIGWHHSSLETQICFTNQNLTSWILVPFLLLCFNLYFSVPIGSTSLPSTPSPLDSAIMQPTAGHHRRYPVRWCNSMRQRWRFLVETACCVSPKFNLQSTDRRASNILFNTKQVSNMKNPMWNVVCDTSPTIYKLQWVWKPLTSRLLVFMNTCTTSIAPLLGRYAKGHVCQPQWNSSFFPGNGDS